MSFLGIVDKIIHAVPIFPKKLQGTWIDKIWEKISDKKKEGDDHE